MTGDRRPELAQELMREALRRALAAKLTEQEHRALLAAVILVPLYDRPEDDLWTAQVTAETGMSDRNARDALKGLADKGVFNRWAGPGRRPSRISFAPNDETGPGEDRFTNHETSPRNAGNRPSGGRKPASPGADTEKPSNRDTRARPRSRDAPPASRNGRTPDPDPYAGMRAAARARADANRAELDELLDEPRPSPEELARRVDELRANLRRPRSSS